MSCQSLAARAFLDNDKEMTHCTTFHRSVRFSSESRASARSTTEHEDKKETSGSLSLTALVTPVSQGSAMSQSAPSNSVNFDLDQSSNQSQSCRFPKLEECAHFHYERVCLGGLSIEVVPCEDSCDESCDEGWICLKVRSHVNTSPEEAEVRALNASWSEGSDVAEWTLTRSRENLLRLDDILHKCIYDRKVSGLPNLSTELVSNLDEQEYQRLISDYMHHLSIIADDTINCGPALNWLQMDNKGHKLLVANEDSSSINTPAVAAAYSVRKYVSQARDEISFDVGDMISIIDMPGPQESLWWRGKRGFRVGFFPHHCVAVIGDKVPRHMTQPPPIVGSVAMTAIKPVLRKHGKLISLFRSFILSRPSRRALKQQGILRERVFGCDLGEHLLNCGHHVPLVLVECASAIESRGAVDGVYRLSGGSGLTQRLRSGFDSGAVPDLSPHSAELARDPHAVPSLLKMYFRELPNPLCTYQLYESFVSAVQLADEAARLRAVRHTVVKLPPPHYRTLAYLMRHLRRVSLLGATTGMTPRNMAIVWAPNLLRAPRHHHALQGVAVQAVVTEFLICFAEELFAQEQGADSDIESIEQEPCEPQVELRNCESGRRPKSLPVNPPTKLLSLEEARRRGGCSMAAPPAPPAPPAATPPDTIPSPPVALRPAAHLKPKYIEVGSGPNNLPQYHTVLDLPLAGGKRGVKRSPAGWRGLFSRTKQQRGRALPPPPHPPPPATHPHPPPDPTEDVPMVPVGLRPVKSCESLGSDTDTLAPLMERPPKPLNHHTRSSSCDSYFEPWQAELAEMRLRLSPQERDHHMFSEEDDTQTQLHQGGSWGSTPAASAVCSAEPSPRRATYPDPPAPPAPPATTDAPARTSTMEELAQISYIDGESPRAPEKRHSARDMDAAKRLCKDRDSPKGSKSDSQTTLVNVKLRDRGSPRKPKTRHSGYHHDIDDTHRLSWHGKDVHSTKIRIDWPSEPSIPDNTPQTPLYDPLETDSELSEKHTITINECFDCEGTTCLKCELKAADSLQSSEISYKNLNRLSAISTSSSERKRAITSSRESSSSNDYEFFARPNYINLQSSSTSPGSPLKSPLKSTISITFRSPNKDRDSVYEDVDLEKNLSIVEDATVPHNDEDASLPTQEAYQPEYNTDLIILETPEEVYSQVKFFKKSIEEVNALLETDKTKEEVFMVELPDSVTEDVSADSVEGNDCVDVDDKNHYENVQFKSNDYENINVGTLKICDNLEIKENAKSQPVLAEDELNFREVDNGNVKTEAKNLNVRELAIRFESPTEQKGPFTFEKFRAEVKYPSLEKNATVSVKSEPKDIHKLNKNSARSLDENAFIKEFGEKDRRKSLEVNRKPTKFLPDFNLNPIENDKITPTTENRISLIQRFNEKRPDIKTIINFDTEKKLSRERIEKYKEERRNFLREKYSSQSFRSNPEQLTRLKIKKEDKVEVNGKFERRNTVDLGQRMRFSLAKSAGELDTIQPHTNAEDAESVGRVTESIGRVTESIGRVTESIGGDTESVDRVIDSIGGVTESVGRVTESIDRGTELRSDLNRKEKLSSYNIRDMAALFEHQQNPNSG